MEASIVKKWDGFAEEMPRKKGFRQEEGETLTCRTVLLTRKSKVKCSGMTRPMSVIRIFGYRRRLKFEADRARLK